MAKVLVPLALQRLTENKGELEISCNSVNELIEELEKKHPGTKRLIAPAGSIQEFINIFVNGKDIRFLSNESTEIANSDEVNIVLAVSGG